MCCAGCGRGCVGGGVLRARGDRLSEVDRLEDGLGVIEDGRLGDLLDVVREEGLGACHNKQSNLDCCEKKSHTGWCFISPTRLSGALRSE